MVLMPGYVDISVSNLPSLGLYRFHWLHWLLLVLGQVFNTLEKSLPLSDGGVARNKPLADMIVNGMTQLKFDDAMFVMFNCCQSVIVYSIASNFLLLDLPFL